MKLYPQSGLMLIHSNGLSDKEQGQEIKGKGETGQDKTQQTVRPEFREAVKNPKGRLAREKEKINVGTDDKRRSILNREERINFYPQRSTRQGLQEEKGEGELQHGGRGYNQSQGRERNKGNRRGEEVQERREEKGELNTCQKGRMGGHVSSGEGRRLVVILMLILFHLYRLG